MAKIKVINTGYVAHEFLVLNTTHTPLFDKTEKVQHRVLKRIIINGKYNKLQNDDRLIVYQGEAITMIDEEDWKYILEKYSHSAPIKQKVIYADSKNSESNLLAYAKEMQNERKLCDPLDINKLQNKIDTRPKQIKG